MIAIGDTGRRPEDEKGPSGTAATGGPEVWQPPSARRPAGRELRARRAGASASLFRRHTRRGPRPSRLRRRHLARFCARPPQASLRLPGQRTLELAGAVRGHQSSHRPLRYAAISARCPERPTAATRHRARNRAFDRPTWRPGGVPLHGGGDPPLTSRGRDTASITTPRVFCGPHPGVPEGCAAATPGRARARALWPIGGTNRAAPASRTGGVPRAGPDQLGYNPTSGCFADQQAVVGAGAPAGGWPSSGHGQGAAPAGAMVPRHRLQPPPGGGTGAKCLEAPVSNCSAPGLSGEKRHHRTGIC
jgi:hypothetical protein